ncbi:MAG: substrate-binding domain-containing protein [Pseudolabrys sp.]
MTSATIHLFAAGSLREALTDVARAFEAASGHTVESMFGPSGLLAAKIASGTHADLFPSANMAHPQALP